VTVRYLREQRHAGTVSEIARVKFPFPGPEHPELETLVNVPKPRMSVGQESGRELYPNIVVVRRPGTWLQMIAEVEMADTVTDESALERWLPYSKVGNFYLYVPFGMAGEARKIAKRHGVHLSGLRVWRFRPVWGLDVADA
jgi:hypothetical protein